MRPQPADGRTYLRANGWVSCKPQFAAVPGWKIRWFTHAVDQQFGLEMVSDQKYWSAKTMRRQGVYCTIELAHTIFGLGGGDAVRKMVVERLEKGQQQAAGSILAADA